MATKETRGRKKLPGKRQNIRFIAKQQRTIERAVKKLNRENPDGAVMTFNKFVGASAFKEAKKILGLR